ncbi:hypothetical protein ACX40Y_09105 [Sphingomonas sp. RS6]
MRTFPLLIASTALLAGCAQDSTRYPSLLPRPAETGSFDEPVRTPAVEAPDPAFEAQVADAVAALDAAHAKWQAAAVEAEAKVRAARGQAPGTAAWLDAQTALSTLDTLRGSASTVLADLDRIAIEHRIAGHQASPALEAAVAHGQAIVADQDRRSASLESSLAGS